MGYCNMLCFLVCASTEEPNKALQENKWEGEDFERNDKLFM